MLLKRSIIPLVAACLALLGVAVVLADSGAPGISGVGSSGVSTSTATIQWTTATSSTSVVRYATSTSALASSTAAVIEESNLATTTSHAVPLSGLIPDTEYFFEVESSSDDVTEVDNDGGSFHTFTTDEVVDDGDNDGDGERRKAVVGVISGFATSTVGTTTVVTSVTLTKKGTEELVTINLGTDVQMKFPGGPKNSWASLEEAIDGGAEVVILTRPVDAEKEAIFVLVKPKSVTYRPYVGPVVEVDGDVFTILLPNGKTKKVKGHGRGDAPGLGDIVTAFVGPNGDGDGDGGEPSVASGLVKASKVTERIERFLDKLAAKTEDLPEAALNARARLVSSLAAVLEAHTSQQVGIVQNLSNIETLRPGLALGLQKALEKAQASHAKGKSVADDAKSRVGPVQNSGRGPKNIFGPGGSDDDSGGSGRPANAGSQGSDRGNKGNSGD